MTQPLLTLETLVPDRPYINIDGSRYELALPDDFGILQSARMARLLRVARETEDAAAAAPKDGPIDASVIKALEDIVDEQLALILYAPDEVRARLSDKQKLEIIAAFTPAVEARTAKPPRPTKARRQTSGSSSSSSRRPTARRRG